MGIPDVTPMPARPWHLTLIFITASLSGALGNVRADVFINESFRVGAFPDYPGSGWFAEVYLDIPDADARSLFFAETYIESTAPDFTFRTEWIDFPAGTTAYELDADYATMGDLLNDYLTDVSDPSKLDEPIRNFVIRFSGLLKVRLEDDTVGSVPPPAWVDFGTYGYDGYRLKIAQTIYRFPLVAPLDFFWRENGIMNIGGLYPIEYTWFNQWDPMGTLGTETVGMELYSWHGGGLELPGGENMNHPQFGFGTIVNPAIIYQPGDEQPVPVGDFDGDGHVNLRDANWFNICFSGPLGEVPILLGLECDRFDFDKDTDVDIDDYVDLMLKLEPN